VYKRQTWKPGKEAKQEDECEYQSHITSSPFTKEVAPYSPLASGRLLDSCIFWAEYLAT